MAYIIDTLRCPVCRKVMGNNLRVGSAAPLTAACWSQTCPGVVRIDVPPGDRVVHLTDDALMAELRDRALGITPAIDENTPAADVERLADQLAADAMIVPSEIGEAVVARGPSTVATKGRRS